MQPKSDEALAKNTSFGVLLQILLVRVMGRNNLCTNVRALIDSAPQRSYISLDTVSRIYYKSIHQESLKHSLFGGKTMGVITDDVYLIKLSILDGSYICHFETLDQQKICGDIALVTQGPWIKKLAKHKKAITDFDSRGLIELLLGADVAEKFLTGGLSCGSDLVQTKLRWTLIGKVPGNNLESANLAMRELQC